MPAKTTSKSVSAKASTRTAKAVKTPASTAKKASSKVAVKTAVAPVTKAKKAPTNTTAKEKAASASVPAPTPVLAEPVISNEEIQLRAFYISERRHSMGWPGNASTDWIEAEAQLVAEAKKRLKKAL